MCVEFKEYSYYLFFWVNMLTIIVVALNFVLREICVLLINWIRFKTETVRIAKVTKFTFFSIFINTAILPLLINANLNEQPILKHFHFNGPFNDFNSDWFRLTGNLLVSTMIFNAYFPVLEFGINYVIRFISRLYDSKWTNSNWKTRAKSIHAYIENRSGPIYYIHFRYAAILNIVFVTFMFGFGMPLLFPIAAASFLILYVTEVLQLYYSYRAPPNYDKKVSEEVLSLLKFAPALYLAFGYWMISSMQLFENKYLTPIERASDIMPSNHTINQVYTPIGW